MRQNNSTSVPIVTTQQALIDGLTPATFLSIAKIHEDRDDYETGRAARAVAAELAEILGIDLGGRWRRRGKTPRHNNSRRTQPALRYGSPSRNYGSPRNRRAA